MSSNSSSNDNSSNDNSSNDNNIDYFLRLYRGLRGYDSDTKKLLTDAERIEYIESALKNRIKFIYIGDNPIELALSERPSLPILKYLISKGQRFDVNRMIGNKYGGFLPLEWIIYRRYIIAHKRGRLSNVEEFVDFVNYLIKHGARIHTVMAGLDKLPLFCYVVDPEVMKIFLSKKKVKLLSSYYDHAEYMKILFSSKFLNIDLINFILDYYGNNLLNGTTHIVLFFIKALKDLSSWEELLRSKRRFSKLNAFLDILEARGFDKSTPLDDTGRTLVMELADVPNIRYTSNEVITTYPERNIYGRTAAFYKRMANSQTARRPSSRGGKYSSRRTTRRR